MKEEIKSLGLDKHDFETRKLSVIETFLAFLYNEDPIAESDSRVA